MADIPIVPGGYWVICKPKAPEKTKTGIILPTDVDKSEGVWATVVAVSAGERVDDKTYPIPFEAGDCVVINPMRAVEIRVLGVLLIAVNWREVIFALRGPDGLPLGEHAPDDPARG